jgi:hypothetical protein
MKWYALDVDEGVVAEAPTKRELVEKIKYDFIKEKTSRVSKGFYEMTDADPDSEYQNSYYLLRSDASYLHGFEWAIEQYEAPYVPIIPNGS